jgi:hypothetical protein
MTTSSVSTIQTRLCHVVVTNVYTRVPGLCKLNKSPTPIHEPRSVEHRRTNTDPYPDILQRDPDIHVVWVVYRRD